MNPAITGRLDEVRERADSINLARLALVLIVGLFWGLGWVARKVFRSIAYLAAAVQVGWREAGPATPPARR